MSDALVTGGLLAIFVVVLILPFTVRIIERNLEVFLFLCGIVALTISGFAVIPGEETGWSLTIIREALAAPLCIATVWGVPIGIVQIVLLVGLVLYIWHRKMDMAIRAIVERCPIPALLFILIAILGLVSSVISAILAAVLLVEFLCALPLSRQAKVEMAVVSCFAIGLGAGLTPLGEPLSTIVVAKLAGAPYHAGFDYLVRLLGVYIVPAVILLAFIGVFMFRRSPGAITSDECHLQRESIREVVLRAARVYLFIMALIFLGEGFKPLILAYIIQIPAGGLYWVNMVSAVLDNATLAAAEIGPALSVEQIRSALMGLLIAGGMLIPGNIPNIIAAQKLGITSREWARTGVPLGLVLLLIFFVIFFIPPFAGLH